MLFGGIFVIAILTRSANESFMVLWLNFSDIFEKIISIVIVCENIYDRFSALIESLG